MHSPHRSAPFRSEMGFAFGIRALCCVCCSFISIRWIFSGWFRDVNDKPRPLNQNHHHPRTHIADTNLGSRCRATYPPMDTASVTSPSEENGGEGRTKTAAIKLGQFLV